VLTVPDLNRPFTVISDASTIASGAVLIQDDRVVAYTSKKFSPAEFNYTTGEQEFLWVINALKEWRCYLEGAPDVTLVTDHHPNTYLQSPGTTLSRRQARWVEYLSRFHYTWKAIPGRINVADPITRQYFKNQTEEPVDSTDTLSRLCHRQVDLGTSDGARTPRGEQVDPLIKSYIKAAAAHVREPASPSSTDGPSVEQAPSTPLPEFLDAIKGAYGSDPWFRIRRHLKGMRQEAGIWYKQGRVVVPENHALRCRILHEAHDSPLGGHTGVERTLARITAHFWWKRINRDVTEYVGSCDPCQRNKVPAVKPGGLLNPLPIPARRWGSISVDAITGLPMTATGFDAIIVFACRLIKQVHFIATTTDVNTAEFATLFFDNVVSLHGVPSDIVSDRGSLFTSDFWTGVCQKLGIR
jgi:hypothetical protein